jgi:hypothetical protein
MFIYSLAIGAALASAQPEQDNNTPLVEFPHPLITEILAVVPKGDTGDANKDGTRDATTDEFVELMNPHDEDIELGGYTITDRNAGGQGAVEFTFPSMTLEPGEVVVVFNGKGTKFATQVGTEQAQADEKEEAFDAWVFVMENAGQFAGFSNKGDWVLLSDENGKPIHVVSWGTFKEKLPAGEGLIKEQPSDGSEGSMCRYLVGGPIVGHSALDGRKFSPGEHPIRARMTGEDQGR